MALVVRDKRFTVNTIINTLKKQKDFPVSIPTTTCPNRDPKCKLHHGDYLIMKYERKTDRFFVRSYSVHKENYLESWFQSIKLNEMLLRCLIKKKITIPKLTKIIDISDTYRKKVISLRYSELEHKKLLRKSKKANLTVNDYIREKSLN